MEAAKLMLITVAHDANSSVKQTCLNPQTWVTSYELQPCIGDLSPFQSQNTWSFGEINIYFKRSGPPWQRDMSWGGKEAHEVPCRRKKDTKSPIIAWYVTCDKVGTSQKQSPNKHVLWWRYIIMSTKSKNRIETGLSSIVKTVGSV